MANITYSGRNNPTTTHGTVEPIKVQATTQASARSQVGMAPRTPNSPATAQEPVKAAEPTVTATPGAEASTKISTENADINAKFSALARKEKALRQKYTEFQAKEQELQQLRDEATKAKAYRERLKTNPLDLLNEEGITYEQLVQKAVNLQNPINNDVMALQKQIKALEDTLQKQQEESQKSQQTQRQQAEKQIHLDVQSLISSDPEFKAVKDMGADEAVTQLIVSTYDEDGILLTTEQAANQVKEYLLEEAKRITGILNPTPPLEEAVKQQGAQPIQKNTRTLSNTMVASEAPPKNWAEKKARIISKYSRK